MIRVRDVFQAKYGRIDELLVVMKQMTDEAPPDTPAPFREARLLTDMSGPYFTLVLETEFESMAEWEDAFAQLMASQGSGEAMQRMNELTRSGHREFFRIEN